MKTAAFAIALLMGGAAIAQTTTTDASTSVQNDTAQSTMSHSATTDSTAQRTMSADSNQAMAGMQTSAVVQPGNNNPEHDARGIAVISAPAVVPGGWNGVVAGATGGPLVDPATGATIEGETAYPACSASVTDNCVQTYERGRRR